MRQPSNTPQSVALGSPGRSRSAEPSYRVIVEHMNEGAVTLTCDGRVVYCNARFADLCRTTVLQLANAPIRGFFAPTDWPAFDDLLRRAESQGGTLEVQLVADNGSIVPVLLSANALPEGDGGAFCMVVTDLGQHRRQHEELGVAERMARSILEQASEAIVVCDEDGRIIRASHAAHHLCGQSALWKLFDDVFHLRRGGSAPLLREPPPDEEDRFLLSPLLGSGRPLRTEVHFRRDDGKHFALLLSVGPMHELRGDVRGCVVTMADISERRRAEEELWRLTDSLEHRVSERTAELAAINRELEAFSYSVSHDLRAPLRAIEGFGRSLQEDCGDDLGEPGKSHLARMRAATRLMRDLIDDLLRLAQVTSGRLVRERVDLSALARTIAAALALAEPERTVRVAIADGLTAGGDLGLLRVALENLLGNAWKFTAQRPLAEVELGEMLTTEGKVFYVRDNGAGFDMKEADRLFAPFQRLHAPGEFSGTGVGLATVQRIIHRHGGRIWAEAAPRRGATFFFTL